MRFPPSLLDEIRARLPVSQVVARKVALKRAGREYKGLSPFKTERTPSFTVNDQKGFYHCFATGEHGDIFTFLVKTEGLSFPEAVERLAQEAGVPMPKAGPRDEEREDERTRLLAILAASAKFFEDALKGPQGRDARRYLEGRQLTPEAVTRFRLGYAPAGRSALKEHLAQAGFSAADMATSGMLIGGDDIPVAYDRFRHRIMFPITDLKGRVIAFGGRALDPDAPAKYLNSPETPLFHKGAVLFNAHNARSAAHDKGQVLVVEGYMDVIALSEAGFPQTVAPLGTALTPDQITLLWRMAAEPILCFDGDAAGRRAAFRAVETALPGLRPGHSLQFAFLPDGLDPDDLVRQRGAAGMEAVLTAVRPLVDVLWERELAAGPVDTPERRAVFEQRLETLIRGIGDARVQGLYRHAIRDRLWRTWRKGDPKSRQPGLQVVRTVPDTSAGETLLLALIAHPWLLDAFTDEIAQVPLASDVHRRALAHIQSLHAGDEGLDRDTLVAALQEGALGALYDHLVRNSAHKGVAFANSAADIALVRQQFAAFIDGAHSGVMRKEEERIKKLLEQEPTEDLLREHAALREEMARQQTRSQSASMDRGEGERSLDQTLADVERQFGSARHP
jgi:DNA primase